VISTCSSEIPTRSSVIFTRILQSSHLKCDFDMHECNLYTHKCSFDTFECDYDTHECDFDTLESVLGSH
jgi:hypothetical protein